MSVKIRQFFSTPTNRFRLRASHVHVDAPFGPSRFTELNASHFPRVEGCVVGNPDLLLCLSKPFSDGKDALQNDISGLRIGFTYNFSWSSPCFPWWESSSSVFDELSEFASKPPLQTNVILQKGKTSFYCETFWQHNNGKSNTCCINHVSGVSQFANPSIHMCSCPNIAKSINVAANFSRLWEGALIAFWSWSQSVCMGEGI